MSGGIFFYTRTPFHSTRRGSPCERYNLQGYCVVIFLFAWCNPSKLILTHTNKKKDADISTSFCSSRKEGDSNPRYPNRVRQFSKLVVSATHPSFLTDLH